MLKKYLNDFHNKYSNDKDIIIDSFIEYYGNEYSDRIRSRINNLNIFCYVPLMFHYSLMPKDLLAYLENIKVLYSKTNDVSILLEKLAIGYNCKELFELCKNKLDVNYLLQSCSLYELDLVILPIVYNLSHITHEFNHIVINNALIDEPNVSTNGVEISIRDGRKCFYQNTIFSEILCERSNHDIQRIQQSRGLNSELCLSWQYNYFKFVERFYQTFKEVYKYSILSGNLNTLINSVGEQNYRDLVNIITYLRTEEEKQNSSLSNDVILFALKEIDDIVDKMIIYYDNARRDQLSVEEINKYINESGHKRLSLNNYYVLPEINS